MPFVTATPRGLRNGEVVTEFTDTTSTASVTYTYPIQQAGISIENSGIADIFVTVGSYTNQVVNPNKKWKADVSFISFSIRSDENSQEFTSTSFQNDVDGSDVADSVARSFAQKSIMLLNRNLVVSVVGQRVLIAFKYDPSNDMWIEFNRLGVNNLPMIRNVFLAANTSSRVSTDLERTSTVLANMQTDFVGPYIVKADANPVDVNGVVNGAGGVQAASFTGGVHGYSGSTSDTRKTAGIFNYKTYADGQQLNDGDIVTCNRVDIEVVNDIQGYNTKKVDGTGRAILRETIHYTITPNSIEVTADIKALEAVTIETYYGLQTMNDGGFGTGLPGWNGQVHYVNGSLTTRTNTAGASAGSVNSANSDSGAKSSYSNVDRFCHRFNPHNLIAWVDNSYGLGTRSFVDATQPLAFTTSVNKSYMNLVKGVLCPVASGVVVSWRGGYVFYSTNDTRVTCPGSDAAFTYLEGNQRKYIIDFLSANTGTTLGTNQSDRNKPVTVDSKSSAVTVGSRVGSIGLNLSTTGYGQAKITVV